MDTYIKIVTRTTIWMLNLKRICSPQRDVKHLINRYLSQTGTRSLIREHVDIVITTTTIYSYFPIIFLLCRVNKWLYPRVSMHRVCVESYSNHTFPGLEGPQVHAFQVEMYIILGMISLCTPQRFKWFSSNKTDKTLKIKTTSVLRWVEKNKSIYQSIRRRNKWNNGKRFSWERDFANTKNWQFCHPSTTIVWRKVDLKTTHD